MPFRLSDWMYRIAFLVFIFFICMFRLRTNNLEPDTIYGPDLIYCLMAAWIIRRPDFIPVYIIIITFGFYELIFGLPPGLWITMMLIVSEFLRTLSVWALRNSLLLEWLLVSCCFACALLLYQLILFLTFLTTASLIAIVSTLLLTIICYPFAVLVTNLIFVKKVT